jgi:hypothetical protein
LSLQALRVGLKLTVATLFFVRLFLAGKLEGCFKGVYRGRGLVDLNGGSFDFFKWKLEKKLQKSLTKAS